MYMKAIACVEKNLGLGLDGDLLVKSKKDLSRFKRLTMGYAVVMGRKTFESLGNKPLVGRTNVVISSSLEPQDDVVVFRSIDDFLTSEYNCKDTFVIGGSTVYRQMLPYVDELYLTEVDISLPADTFFPEFKEQFVLVEKEFSKDKDLVMEYCKYDRIGAQVSEL